MVRCDINACSVNTLSRSFGSMTEESEVENADLDAAVLISYNFLEVLFVSTNKMKEAQTNKRIQYDIPLQLCLSLKPLHNNQQISLSETFTNHRTLIINEFSNKLKQSRQKVCIDWLVRHILCIKRESYIQLLELISRMDSWHARLIIPHRNAENLSKPMSCRPICGNIFTYRMISASLLSPIAVSSNSDTRAVRVSRARFSTRIGFSVCVFASKISFASRSTYIYIYIVSLHAPTF